MLRRRVLDPVQFVMRIDPAIDLARSDYERYRETWSLQHLVWHEGQRPTIFVLHQLTHAQRVAVRRLDDAFAAAELALRYGLMEVRDYMIERSDGQMVPLAQPRRGPSGDAGDCITKEWLEEARFLSDELIAIGGTIVAISEARAPFS